VHGYIFPSTSPKNFSDVSPLFFHSCKIRANIYVYGGHFLTPKTMLNEAKTRLNRVNMALEKA